MRQIQHSPKDNTRSYTAPTRRNTLAVDLLLKGGMVVTGGGVVRADVAVSGEKIAGIAAPGETTQAKRVVDISGLHLLPGLIDMHSHHREPGFTHKEDIIT